MKRERHAVCEKPASQHTELSRLHEYMPLDTDGILIAPRSREASMPETRTLKRARRDRRQGKAASTQAGEFVREEMEHIRSGKHGARSTKQAIDIGLSKARRAGVKLPPPRRGRVSEKTRRSAASAYRLGQTRRSR